MLPSALRTSSSQHEPCGRETRFRVVAADQADGGEFPERILIPLVAGARREAWFLILVGGRQLQFRLPWALQPGTTDDRTQPKLACTANDSGSPPFGRKGCMAAGGRWTLTSGHGPFVSMQLRPSIPVPLPGRRRSREPNGRHLRMIPGRRRSNPQHAVSLTGGGRPYIRSRRTSRVGRQSKVSAETRRIQQADPVFRGDSL